MVTAPYSSLRLSGSLARGLLRSAALSRLSADAFGEGPLMIGFPGASPAKIEIDPERGRGRK